MSHLLYVALTRAKELLIITGTSKDLEKDMAKWQAQPPEYGLVDLIGAKSFLAMLMPLITDVSAQPYFAIETWDSSRLTTQAAEEMAEDILSYEDLKHWESSVCYDEEIRDEICAEEAYSEILRGRAYCQVRITTCVKPPSLEGVLLNYCLLIHRGAKIGKIILFLT